MKNLMKRIEEINKEHNAMVNQIIEDEIVTKDQDLNEIISEFCSKVCELYGVPNDDLGPMPSYYCSKLDKEITINVKEWVKEQSNNV